MRLSFPRDIAPNPMYRAAPIAHEVPIATIDRSLYVLTDGSLAAVYRVAGKEYDLADGSAVAEYCESLRSVLNRVPLGMHFKFLHRITSNYRPLLDEHSRELNGLNHFARYLAWDQARRMQDAMERGEVRRSENLIVLTYNPRIRWWESPKRVKALLDEMLPKGGPTNVVQRTKAMFQLAIDKFERASRPVFEQMGYIGLNPVRLDTRELKELAWEVLNPRESLRRPCPDIQRVALTDPYAGLFARPAGKKAVAKRPDLAIIAPITEREQLAVSNWRVGPKWVRVDDRYYGAVYLRVLPQATYPTMALALSSLDFDCTISIDAEPMKKMKEVEHALARARSERTKSMETLLPGAPPDPMKALHADELEKRHQQLLDPNQTPFAFRFVISVSAPSQTLLAERCDRVLGIVRNMEDTHAMREEWDGVPALLKSQWPFSIPTDNHRRTALTSQVANMMPIFDRWAGSKRPVTLVFDRAGRIVKHDPFPTNQLNRNRTITGKSGSGKSFACQLLDVQPHAARKGTEILIIESGGSFEFTVRLFGGLYLKLGPSCPYQMNPFDLPPGFEDMSEKQQEEELQYKFGFIKNLVLAMARLSDPQSTMLAENVLGSIAQRTYAFSKQPRFRDFYRILGQYQNPEDKHAEELAGRLRTLIANYVVKENGEAGIFSRYFDCFTNFPLDNPIVCFDLIDVKNDPALLTPMTMITLLGLIYNRLMKRDGTERLVIVDEAWALVKEGPNGEQSPAGQGIELFWREGRKLGASSTMLSQNYSDMTKDKVGRAVVGNSPIQYYLVHERLKDNDDAFKSANFSDEKLDRVYNLKTEYGQGSEVMVKEGEEWGILRVPSPPLRYWAATTDYKDTEIRDRYLEKYHQGFGLSLHATMAILAEDHPGGYHVAAHAPEMSDDEALRFGERFEEHYRRFCGLVDQGRPVPLDFR